MSGSYRLATGPIYNIIYTYVVRIQQNSKRSIHKGRIISSARMFHLLEYLKSCQAVIVAMASGALSSVPIYLLCVLDNNLHRLPIRQGSIPSQNLHLLELLESFEAVLILPIGAVTVFNILAVRIQQQFNRHVHKGRIVSAVGTFIL